MFQKSKIDLYLKMKRWEIGGICLLLGLFGCKKTEDSTGSEVKLQTEVQINASVFPAASGTVQGNGVFQLQNPVTLTASCEKPFRFLYWEENGQVVSTANPYTFVATASHNLIARFQDYRDPLCGVYQGTRQNVFWTMNGGGHDTTYAYQFDVVKLSSPDSIMADGISVKLDSVNQYYSMPYPGQITSVSFRNDSCLIFLRSGGLGGYSSSNRNGKKI